MFNKITLLGVLAMLCLNFSAMAQKPISEIKPNSLSFGDSLSRTQFGSKGGALKVGDRLPEIFWTTKHKVYRNGIVSEENLLALKGHILIIDFWASWCTNCINRFSKAATLSEKHQAIAKVLLVNTKGNKDKISQIDAVYKRLNADSLSFRLPSIVEDTLINALLKPTFLPHYVWVSREGKVVAITNSDFVDEAPLKSMHLQNLKLDSLRRQKREAKP